MRLISANSRLFTPIEMRLSTLIRECSAIIFALTECEFLLSEKTHYPVVANIHNIYFEINIDKNEYHPISYEKYNKETKTNLIPKYKPKTKNWQSPIVEKDDLIIERNQKGPYTVHHDDDYLRLINNIKQEHNYDNSKITDIFNDEKTKVTEDLIRETQIIDPVLHKIKLWKNTTINHIQKHWKYAETKDYSHIIENLNQ